jgi:hypothetical protein
VSTRSLRARLNRLRLSALSVIGQDRERDRQRRYVLQLSRATLTRLEQAELRQLDLAFEEEDRDGNRRFELSLKESGRDAHPLTEAEHAELAELDKRYPPDPNDPLKPFWEACGAVVLALDRESKE